MHRIALRGPCLRHGVGSRPRPCDADGSVRSADRPLYYLPSGVIHRKFRARQNISAQIRLLKEQVGGLRAVVPSAASSVDYLCILVGKGLYFGGIQDLDFPVIPPLIAGGGFQLPDDIGPRLQSIEGLALVGP